MGKNKKEKDKKIMDEEANVDAADNNAKGQTEEAENTKADKDEKIEASAKKTEAAEDKEPTLEDINKDLNDRLLRNMAEFENFRKRTEKEKAARFEFGQRSVIEKILPVIDNFERGLANLDDKDAFAEGMEKTYKQMLDLLESLNVKPIEAVGKEFDPNFHNAVMHIEDETLGENIVVEELQKGYTMNETVIRYSMVKVAN